MRYEVEAATPPVRLGFALVITNGPAIEPEEVVDFPVSHGTDARFFRAFAFKPTREGLFDLVLHAYDGDGRTVAETTCSGIQVTP